LKVLAQQAFRPWAMPFPGERWKSNVFFCQFIESSAYIERFSVIIVGLGGCMSNRRRKVFFHFTFVMTP